MARTRGTKELLQELVHVPGINLAVVVGRDGFVIDGVSESNVDTEAVGAVISTGIGSTEVMGGELNVGKLHQSMVECEKGVIVTSLLGETAILAVVADLKAPLGNIRYQIKKVLPDLEAAL